MRKDVALSVAAALLLMQGAGKATAGTALLFDATDGHVLYAEDLDTPWYPASLTKLMTAYLAFVAIREQRATKQTPIFISPHAHKQPPTRLGLKVGRSLPLGDALRALIMRSANDVAVAIAETLAGSELSFVKEMNQTAARLGMTHTHFLNPHGLPDERQVTTARDMALLTQALLRDFPEEAPLFAEREATIAKIAVKTHNGMLKSFPGGDGIKTGYTCASGYNLIASATRDGHRLVAVVLGETSNAARNGRAAALLERGFYTRPWMASAPTARVKNYPSVVVGANFEPDAALLERFRACKVVPQATRNRTGEKPAAKKKPRAGAASQKARGTSRRPPVQHKDPEKHGKR